MEKIETPTCCEVYNGTICDIISDFNLNNSNSFSNSSNSFMHQVFEDYDSNDDSDEMSF